MVKQTAYFQGPLSGIMSVSIAKHADACAMPVFQGKCAFFGSTVPSRGQRLAAARQSRSSLRVNAAKQSGKQFSVRYYALSAVACNLLSTAVPASSPEVRHRALVPPATFCSRQSNCKVCTACRVQAAETVDIAN